MKNEATVFYWSDFMPKVEIKCFVRVFVYVLYVSTEYDAV